MLQIKGGLLLMYMYFSLALTLAAGIGFVYGLFRFFRDESALYVRMIVFGVGCAMLGRLFATLLYLVNGDLFPGFNVGMLGIVGSFLFFFSANFGQMDSIVDDGSPRFRKTRIIALTAPLIVAALCVVIFVVYGFNEATIPFGIEALFLALASYFHLKHLIIEDVSFGLIKSIRSYNLLALVYAALCLSEVLVEGFVPALIVTVLECAVLIAFIPVLERGMKKWTT